MNTCVCMVASFCCVPETITILFISYNKLKFVHQNENITSHTAQKSKEKKAKKLKETEDIPNEPSFQDFEYPEYDDYRGRSFPAPTEEDGMLQQGKRSLSDGEEKTLPHFMPSRVVSMSRR